eukprot:7228954-Alexandrium_andersonii.AAC.1
MAGGIWSDHGKFKADMADSPACVACGCPRGDVRHMLWHCPKHEHLREEVRGWVAEPLAHDLPGLIAVHGWTLSVPAASGLFSPPGPGRVGRGRGWPASFG